MSLLYFIVNQSINERTGEQPNTVSLSLRERKSIVCMHSFLINLILMTFLQLQWFNLN